MSRPVPDEVILGLLKAQPSHGYDLLEYFRSNEHLGRIWHMSSSQLYAVLKRLEEDGSIKGVDVSVQDAPTRREFRILTNGEVQLEKWLSEETPSASLHRIRVIFLSRLYIASLINKPVYAIIQKQIAACKSQRLRFVEEREEAESKIEYLALDLVNNQLSAVIEWLYWCQEKFSS